MSKYDIYTNHTSNSNEYVRVLRIPINREGEVIYNQTCHIFFEVIWINNQGIPVSQRYTIALKSDFTCLLYQMPNISYTKKINGVGYVINNADETIDIYVACAQSSAQYVNIVGTPYYDLSIQTPYEQPVNVSTLTIVYATVVNNDFNLSVINSLLSKSSVKYLQTGSVYHANTTTNAIQLNNYNSSVACRWIGLIAENGDDISLVYIAGSTVTVINLAGTMTASIDTATGILTVANLSGGYRHTLYWISRSDN